MAKSPSDVKISDFLVPKDREALVAWLDRKREAGRACLPERQMKLNLAYMLGEQYVVWDKDHRQFRRPKVRSNDPNAPIRVTVNKIGSIVEHFVSRLTKANPEPECRPVSDDEDDVSAARVSTRIMTSELDRIGFKSLLIQLYFWIVPLGWSYLQICWDPKAGTPIGMLGEEPVYEGDVCIDIVPAPELAVDPNSKKSDLSDAKWAIRTISMTREAVWERWGVLPAADPQRSLAQEVYDLVEQSGDTKQANTETIAVHQMWLRPGSRAMPEGMVVTWAGSTILEEPIPYPYEHGHLPFVQFDLLPGVGTREGRTWVKDLVPLQADYNDARSREAHLRRTLTPKVLTPTGSIDPQRVTSALEVITYNPVGQAPKFEVANSDWMVQYEQGMTRAESEMAERAGQNDISSSTDTKGMPAAAILALQEADDTKLAVTAKLMSRGIELVGWHLLSLARQFWTEERVVRTWSESGELEVQRFSSSDIARQLDVRVQTDTALPRSKSARVQLAMELWQQGLITDPRVYVRMLDLPGTDFIVNTMNLDAKRAHRELGLLVQGIQVPVQPFDNHMVHIEEHDNYRKTQEYENLPDEIKTVIDAHAQVHYELVLSQMSVPTPPGTQQFGMSGTGGPGRAAYLDPTTGEPPDSVMVGMGEAPSALDYNPPGSLDRGGIGAPGEPGRVTGTSLDEQADRMGN